MPLWKQALLRRYAPATDPTDGGKGGGGKPTDADVLDGKGAFDGDPTGGAGGKTTKKDDPPKVERVKVKVGDAEIETDAAAAAALTALMQNNAQMADYIRKGYKEPPKDEPKDKKGYDYATGLFTEPEVAIARLRAEIKQETIAEVSAAYTQAETKKDFWTGFYKDNEDLAGEKLIVEAVLGRDWAKLKDLTPADAAKKLSEAAKKEIMRLSGGKSPADPNPRPVEGAGDGKNLRASGKTGDEKVLSLSDVIRARKEARRKAQFSKE